MTSFPAIRARPARLLLLAAALLSAGCDAPRDNPLDPSSAAFRDAGAVEGRVTGIYPPFEGRAGVRVHLVPLDGGEERVARTGADGAFRVEALPSGRYEVRAERDGLAPGADTVAVAAGQTAEAAFALDALPVVADPVARTVHIENWPPLPAVFALEVEAAATDPDRATDVEAAALVAGAFRAALPETTEGRFGASLDASALPDGRVQSLLGRTLAVEAADRLGNVGVSEPFSLVRVIEQTPLTASPQGQEAVTDNPPVFEWRPSDLPFAFTYRVDVSFQDGAGVLTRVASLSGIPSSETTTRFAEPLAPGAYSWTVWTVDASGNRSRSRPAGFVVP